MTKVCIFNKSNNVLRLDTFKKFFECVNSKISLTCCTKTGAVYAVRNQDQSDFPGPGIFKKKIQDFPGGVGTLIQIQKAALTQEACQG